MCPDGWSPPRRRGNTRRRGTESGLQANSSALYADVGRGAAREPYDRTRGGASRHGDLVLALPNRPVADVRSSRSMPQATGRSRWRPTPCDPRDVVAAGLRSSPETAPVARVRRLTSVSTDLARSSCIEQRSATAAGRYRYRTSRGESAVPDASMPRHEGSRVLSKAERTSARAPRPAGQIFCERRQDPDPDARKPVRG